MASPASAAPSGPLQVHIVNVTTGAGFEGRATITGAVNASCADGPPAVTLGPAGTFHVDDRIVCPHGTLFVSADGTANLQLNPRTCIASLPQSGTFEITGGTDDFVGASGGGTFTGVGRLVFRRTAQGCALDRPPVVEVLRVDLTGDLTT